MKRRRLAILRNFWVYRRLIGTAFLLGLILWFILANNDQVTVRFPFGLWKPTSSLGIVILKHLDDRVADAVWLNERERRVIQDEIAAVPALLAKGGDRETAKEMFTRLNEESADPFIKQICEEQLMLLDQNR